MIKLNLIYRPKRIGLGKPKRASTSTKPTDEPAVTREAENLGSAADTLQPSKFDKTAYQRDYMRRYRANIKAKKGGG